MTLWGEPDQVHAQNMEQLHACSQATENHKIYTRVHRNCESGLVIIYKQAAHSTIYKHAAHRLVHHRLQVVEMAWTDDSTLVWSPVINTVLVISDTVLVISDIVWTEV